MAVSLYIFLELRSMELSAYTSSSDRRASPWKREPEGVDGRVLQLVPKPLRAVFIRQGGEIMKRSLVYCV